MKMEGKMRVHYDAEGDFLEIGIGTKSKSHFEDAGKDVFIRKDEKTGEIKGLAILNFKKRAQKLKDIEIDLPIKVSLSV